MQERSLQKKKLKEREIKEFSESISAEQQMYRPC